MFRHFQPNVKENPPGKPEKSRDVRDLRIKLTLKIK